jgi:hypothetical protein
MEDMIAFHVNQIHSQQHHNLLFMTLASLIRRDRYTLIEKLDFANLTFSSCIDLLQLAEIHSNFTEVQVTMSSALIHTLLSTGAPIDEDHVSRYIAIVDRSAR